MYNQITISKPTWFSPEIEFNEENTESVGKVNPIKLPVIDIGIIKETIGEKITHGDIGTIYKVNGSSTSRVYKVIPQDRFVNGDEIRISKIAGEIGVAPTFHQAFLVKQNLKRYVFIEMEDAGKSLGKLMEDLAENTEIEGNNETIKEEPLNEKEKAFQEMLRKIKAEMDKKPGFVVTEIVQKKKLSTEEVVNKIYKNQEIFYFELFNKIKILAENHIAYGDSHVGNIMPNNNTEKGLQLIDFDAAKIMTDTKTAALESIKSVYNQVHFNKFQTLDKLSVDSIQLISWFTKQLD